MFFWLNVKSRFNQLEKQKTKSYLAANQCSGSDLNLSSHTNLPCENFCFIRCSVSIRKKDIGKLKLPPARYVAKKWIDEVTKSKVLN